MFLHVTLEGALYVTLNVVFKKMFWVESAGVTRTTWQLVGPVETAGN
jgi:hypothetical protein